MARLARTALRLEPLNDRITPSATPTVVLEGGVLTVTGTQRANDIEITDDGTAGGLTVTVDGTDYPVDGTVDSVHVDARAGHDTVSYTLTGDYVGTTRTVEVFLGNGHDTFTADLGHGIDAASSLTLRVDGGNGKDTLSAAGAGALAGGLTVELNGGNGKDDLSFEFAGSVDATGVLDLTADGGNGRDRVHGNVDATADSTGSVTAQLLGWNGRDDVGLWVAGDGLTTGDLIVDGGRGKDTVAGTDNVTILDAEAE